MRTSESVETDEGEIEVLRQEMHRKLGRCLVRLQEYELVMKAFAARHHIEGPSDAFLEALTARERRFADKTLGQVVGEVVGSVFEPPGPDPLSGIREDAPPHLAVRFSMTFPDAAQAAVQSGLLAMVKLRNELVHGFVSRHDISTVSGLSSALDYLNTAHATIDAHFIQLRGWTRTMITTQHALARYVASDAGRETLFGLQGSAPRGIEEQGDRPDGR